MVGHASDEVPSTAIRRQGALGVARALEGVDLDKLTGRSDVLRAVAGFRSQVAPFTEMLEQQAKLAELVTGLSAVDPVRWDILGKAFVSSTIAANVGRDRQRFLDRTTTSISAIAGAQLSEVAKQALLGRRFEISSTQRILDPKAFARATRLSEDSTSHPRDPPGRGVGVR